MASLVSVSKIMQK